jgi:hypothetical protein
MMSFEDTLRRQLHEQAGAVPLPDRRPERAATRARARRRHRLATAGAGVAVLLAGAAAVAVSGDDRPDSVSMAGPGLAGLPQVGPVDLDWQVTDGGLSPSRTDTFQDATGTVYALSTAPGEAGDEEEPARALYRLGDDGAWVPVVLDGSRPRLADASAVGDVIYAVSTAPVAGSNATTAVLSTSGDGGDTWSSEDVAPVAPPSDVIAWDSHQVAGVESVGDTTLAIVTTVFTPNVAQLFPESVGTGMSVEERPEGLALVRPAGGTSGPPTTLVATPDDPAADPPAAEAGVEASGAQGALTEQEMEVVRVVTWAEMGLDGPGQTRTTAQAFRNAGEGWEPVEGDLAGQLAGTSSVRLDVAADQFLITVWDANGRLPRTLRSPDGATWSEVASPTGGDIVAAGQALVALPDPASVEPLDALQASADGGATWEPVDLGPAGLPEGGSIMTYDGGPLGLALVMADEDGASQSVAVTADLSSWTVTPLTDIAGGLDPSGGSAQPFVGADRVLVTVVESDLASEGPPRSRTAVGTPVR